MEKLTSEMKKIVQSKPTNTILRSDDEDFNRKFLKVKKVIMEKDIELPKSFDGRKTWEGLITPVMNQGSCGSCWAFASTSSLSSKFNIQSMGKINVILSPAKLILCNWQGREFNIAHPEYRSFLSAEINKNVFKNRACHGNSLIDACIYLYQTGTFTEKCVPYDNNKYKSPVKHQNISSVKHSEQLPLCNNIIGPLKDMCSDFYIDDKTEEEHGTPGRYYRALHFYSLDSDVKQIMHNIYRWGPIMSAIQIFPDFYTFDPKRDIYSWNGQGPRIGGHAIEIVGWGERNNKEYWIIKNSWGKEWGINGYFYIEKGVNMCGIEDNCLVLYPDFFYPVDYKIPNNEQFIEFEEFSNRRNIINSDVSNAAGGIDPEIGYSRRVISKMPWINFSKPIEISELPNWETFIAGKFSIEKSRDKKRNKSINKSRDKNNDYFYIIIFIILLIFMLFRVLHT